MLRGIAILAVIASHYTEWIYTEPVFPVLTSALSTWGPPAVDIFMLLSGYGLYKSVSSSKNNPAVDGAFVIKRLIASYLPYLLIVGLIYLYAGTWKNLSGTVVIRYFTARDFWYISVLMVLYICFMVSFRFFGRYRIAALTVSVVAYTVWLHSRGMQDYWILSNTAFLIGVYTAALEKRFPEKMSSRRAAPSRSHD